MSSTKKSTSTKVMSSRSTLLLRRDKRFHEVFGLESSTFLNLSFLASPARLSPCQPCIKFTPPLQTRASLTRPSATLERPFALALAVQTAKPSFARERPRRVTNEYERLYKHCARTYVIAEPSRTTVSYNGYSIALSLQTRTTMLEALEIQ